MPRRWGLSADHVRAPLPLLVTPATGRPFLRGERGAVCLVPAPSPGRVSWSQEPLGDLELPKADPWPGLRTGSAGLGRARKARPPRARPSAGAPACSVLSIRVCTGHRPFAEGHPRSVHAWTALSFSWVGPEGLRNLGAHVLRLASAVRVRFQVCSELFVLWPGPPFWLAAAVGQPALGLAAGSSCCLTTIVVPFGSADGTGHLRGRPVL